MKGTLQSIQRKLIYRHLLLCTNSNKYHKIIIFFLLEIVSPITGLFDGYEKQKKNIIYWITFNNFRFYFLCFILNAGTLRDLCLISFRLLSAAFRPCHPDIFLLRRDISGSVIRLLWMVPEFSGFRQNFSGRVEFFFRSGKSFSIISKVFPSHTRFFWGD